MAEVLVCQLCERHTSSQLPFVCTNCTCAAIYEARFSSAQCLLQREANGREVERVIKDGDALAGDISDVSFPASSGLEARAHPSNPSDQGNSDSAQRLAFDHLRSARAQTKLRSRAVYLATQDTEAECKELRERIARRKQEIQQRREKLQADSAPLGQLPSRIEAINLSIAKIDSKGDLLARKTFDARAFMVREAADIWGLAVKRKRQRDGRAREMAYLAGLPAPDLRDLLSAKPEQLNASLLAIVYLLNQTCSYLGLQMPSQLLLPDKDCAWPRIVPVHSSYTELSISNFETAPRSLQQGNDMYSSQTQHTGTPSGSEAQNRARALYLRRPLLKLFTEDAVTYESFVEAMCLLAFNIAWLGKTQGVDVCQGRKGWSWEGACDLGRNLWLLFRPAARKAEPDDAAKEEAQDEALVRLGTFSHGTSKNNAAGPDAAVLGLKEWRLANPNYLIRKIKDALADRKMAGEWELLEEEEWDEAPPPGEATSTQQQSDQHVGVERQAKGWQKLRPRN